MLRPALLAVPTLVALSLPLAAVEPEPEPMTAAEFEAYSTGKTLYFATDGRVYGAEQYLSGRRVIWTFLDGACTEGFWYEARGMLCFEYRHDPDDPQCQRFYRTPAGVTVRFENDPAGTEYVELYQSREPLPCTGPEVGA